VSLLGKSLFREPVRRAFEQYLYPPLKGRIELIPAALGEEVVVHGAMALAAEMLATRVPRKG
jgi:glucokinase